MSHPLSATAPTALPRQRAFPALRVSGAHALRSALGIAHHGDLHERGADLRLPIPLGPGRRARLDAIRRCGTLFVHVPKNAGTSISMLLYEAKSRHETIRYFRHVMPGAPLPSFAIWRDPVERFCSAFDFVRHGGGRDVRLAPAFARRYAGFQTLDDALDHLERQRSPYAMDYVFRPQSWFVCDRNGRLAVDHLFCLDAVASLPQHVPALAGQTIPHLNHSTRDTREITPRQRARIEKFYESDLALKQHIRQRPDA